MGILRGEPLSKLARSGPVWFDLAMLEAVAGIERVLTVLPPDRLLFGTHAPFFNAESAVLKLQESELAAPIRQRITVENARTVRIGA
jgi:predicted TIM-barrel fold metal-dependent hydrolase